MNARFSKFVVSIAVIALLALALVPAAAQDNDPEAMMQIVDRYGKELWSGWQFDIADEIIADDFVAHVWPGSGMDWGTYFENVIEPTPTVQPDFSLDYLFMFVDGDYVVAGGYWGGKVNADLPVVDDDERSNGVDIYRIEDGKIAEVWITYDTLSYMQQVGYFPAEGEVLQDVPWDVALGETSSTPEQHKAILAEMVQNVADHDMDAYFAHFTEDAIVYDQDVNLTGEEAQEMMIGIQSAWPDHHAADVSYYAAGDLAVIMFTLVLEENEVEIAGVNIDRFEDGQVAEEWWVYDSFTLTQLTTPPAEE